MYDLKLNKLLTRLLSNGSCHIDDEERFGLTPMEFTLEKKTLLLAWSNHQFSQIQRNDFKEIEFLVRQFCLITGGKRLRCIVGGRKLQYWLKKHELSACLLFLSLQITRQTATLKCLDDASSYGVWGLIGSRKASSS